MKYLILTTDPTLTSWKKLSSYRRTITAAINSGQNVKASIEVLYCNLSPVVINERIAHVWISDTFLPYFRQGYDKVALHMGDRQRREYGIKPSLRGSNPKTVDGPGDFYFWANEDTLRDGLPQFVQTFLHEDGHEYYWFKGKTDKVHLYHSKNPDISPLFETFDWEGYTNQKQQLRHIITLRERVEYLYGLLALRQKRETLIHPVADFKTYISQGYGVRNAIYSLTGVHIGTDYRTPEGTPVRAPANGQVTVAGYTKALGNFCYFRYTFLGEVFTERWSHLKAIPEQGRYAQGELVARTGNTGMSTGPHFHHDIWQNNVDLTIINRNNWDQLTVDPQKHYV